MTPVCSVYELKFPNGKSYIGISKDPERRWRDHCRFAFKYEKKSALYNAMRAHGKESIQRHTLLVSTLDYCREMEVKLIAAWQTQRPHGYNILPGGDMSPFVTNPELAKLHGEKIRGLRHSQASKDKMSAAHMGVKKSDSAKLNMSAAAKIRAGRKAFFHWAAMAVRFAYGECLRDKREFSLVKGGV